MMHDAAYEEQNVQTSEQAPSSTYQQGTWSLSGMQGPQHRVWDVWYPLTQRGLM